MSTPILDWEDKVNDPELLAFLEQYGTVNYLSAQQINELRDFVNMLSDKKMDKTAFVNPFLNLKLIDKGAQNGVANTGDHLEPYDIVRGFFDAKTFWPAAYYLGGDPLLRTSWQPTIEFVNGSTAVVPPTPPPTGARNFTTHFSPIHFKIYNT